MIPSRRLVLLALAPLVVAMAAVLEPALLRPMLGLDAVVALVAALDALLARGRLVRVEREAPRVLSVGRDNAVRLHVRSLAGRPLAISVTDDLPEGAEAPDLPATVRLGPRGQATLTYHLRPSRRGAYALGAHHVRHPSPLGLWLRQLRLPAEDAVRVYPDLKAVRTYELLARQNREAGMTRAVRRRGGESEFERLRDHVKDDEFRTIDWKATARRQRLIAREYQQERNQSIVCLVDCGRLMTTESAGLSHLDHALNAVLMMSHVAARSGDQVGLCAYDTKVRVFVPPGGGARATHRLIQSSYDLHPSLVESDHRAAFDFLATRVRRRALVILFTQVIDDVAGSTVLRLMRALTPHHLPLCALFRDGALDALVDGAPARTGDGRLFIRGAAAEMILWRERLVRDLKAGGALVLHTLPHRLTPALVNRYLEIKAQQML
jgi:uncharacterized protein (DUF58 family)